MDYSFSELNLNSVETLPGYEARAAFTVNSATIFREEVDIVPTIVDEHLSYIPWGGDNLMPFKIIESTSRRTIPSPLVRCSTPRSAMAPDCGMIPA